MKQIRIAYQKTPNGDWPRTEFACWFESVPREQILFRLDYRTGAQKHLILRRGDPKLTVKPTRLRHQSLVAFVVLVVAGAAVCVLCEAAILNNPSNIPGGGRFHCARIQ